MRPSSIKTNHFAEWLKSPLSPLKSASDREEKELGLLADRKEGQEESVDDEKHEHQMRHHLPKVMPRDPHHVANRFLDKMLKVEGDLRNIRERFA